MADITYFDTDTLEYETIELPILPDNEEFIINPAIIDNYKDVKPDEVITDEVINK